MTTSKASFEGKVIAISGGASGIGLATAQLLASRGASLSLADVNTRGLEEAAKSIEALGAKVIFTKTDCTKPADCKAWIQRTLDTFGKLDGAANMAGVIGKGVGIMGVHNMTDEEWHFVMDININGTFYSLREQTAAMAKGGSIVNTASVAGNIGMAFNAAYASSKHAVIGLTRSAAKENALLRVNAICPGLVLTPLAVAAKKGLEDAGLNAEAIPPSVQPRAADASEIAPLVAFLLSEESSFCTGGIYNVDGGWLC